MWLTLDSETTHMLAFCGHRLTRSTNRGRGICGRAEWEGKGERGGRPLLLKLAFTMIQWAVLTNHCIVDNTKIRNIGLDSWILHVCCLWLTLRCTLVKFELSAQDSRHKAVGTLVSQHFQQGLPGSSLRVLKYPEPVVLSFWCFSNTWVNWPALWFWFF